MTRLTIFALAAILSALASNAEDQKHSEGAAGEVARTVSAAGSQTLDELMEGWAEEFAHLHPQAEVRSETSGARAAARALAEDKIELATMSREMSNAEIEHFRSAHGYAPSAITVAGDAVVLYVHKDNPLKGLTIPQVDAIFSARHACSDHAAVKTWGDLGLTGEWASQPIAPIAQHEDSGTYEYFRERALCGGEYAESVESKTAPLEVIEAVAASPNAIGYGSSAHTSSGVRAVPIARKGTESIDIGRWLIESHGIPTPDTEFVPVTPDNIRSGRYALGRPLYIYVDKPPAAQLPDAVSGFIKFVLSEAGQQRVADAGFLPLPASIAQRGLDTLALH